MTSHEEIMAGVPSPSEMGKAEKFYEKIGDFVLRKDSVSEVKREDGSILSVTCSYTIPREIWESRTGMKFDFKKVGIDYFTYPSEFYPKLKESLYVTNDAWSKLHRVSSPFWRGHPFSTIVIEDNTDIKFSLDIYLDSNDIVKVIWTYYIYKNAYEPPTKLEIYTRINEGIYGLKRLLYPEEEKYAEPAEYPAPSPDVPVYVFFGHGGEHLLQFKSPEIPDIYTRSRLPEGFTLVTITECNTIAAGRTDELKAFEGIGEEKDISIFRDPIKNREAIRKLLGVSEFNIYKAGDEYPHLIYHSLNSGHDEYTRDPITNEVDSRVTTYGKSGVYKLPIALQTFSTEWIQTLDGQYVHKTTGAKAKWKGDEIYNTAKKNFTIDGGDLYAIGSEVKQKIFKDAVWPTPSMLTNDKVISQPRPIYKIFNDLGPGVYYWPICRFGTLQDPKLVRAIRAESRSRHVTRGYGRKRKTYRRKTKKRLLTKR